jgi:hypothetical protein
MYACGCGSVIKSTSVRGHEKTGRHRRWRQAEYAAQCRACGLKECRETDVCAECHATVCRWSTRPCRGCGERVCRPFQPHPSGGRGVVAADHHIISNRYPFCSACLDTRSKVAALAPHLHDALLRMVDRALQERLPAIASPQRAQRARHLHRLAVTRPRW